LPQQRFQQEEALFNFFSNGFAAFEALFYGLFAIGSFIDPGAFRLETQKEQQRVSRRTPMKLSSELLSTTLS
jgi:hypothetical protein